MKLVDNVAVLDVVTRLSIDAERVLQAAVVAKLSNVIVIGYDADGEFYFASSEAGGPSVLWDLEMAKKRLLEIAS